MGSFLLARFCGFFPVGRVLPPVGKRRHHTPRRSTQRLYFSPLARKKGVRPHRICPPLRPKCKNQCESWIFFRPPSGCALCTLRLVTPLRSHLPLPLTYIRRCPRGDHHHGDYSQQKATGAQLAAFAGTFFYGPLGNGGSTHYSFERIEARTYTAATKRGRFHASQKHSLLGHHRGVLFLFCLA